MSISSERRFSSQYRRYHHFVGHALRRVGVAEADVDDLSQEVFVVLLRNVRDLTETGRLMPWLHQVARRVASNHRRGVLRRRRRLRHWTEPTELDDPERALARAQAAGFIADFFDELDPQARPVFLLSEVEGLAGPQIAERLGLNINTTYSRIRSVRRRFAEAVDQQRESSPAWLLMLPSLSGPPVSGPVGWLGVALRTTATQKVLAGLTILLVAVGLMTVTRGSCSAEPEGPQAAPPIASSDHRGRGETADDPSHGSVLRIGATVVGRVEDLDGAGVPGATVCTARQHGAPARCTTADDDGGYSLPGMAAGALWVGASARGYVAAPAFNGHTFRQIRVPGKGTLKGIDLLLRPGGHEVSGLVRDMAGGPIEGATVATLHRRAAFAIDEVSTDERGRFSMWVDTTSFVRVRASADGYVSAQQLLFRPTGDAVELALFPEAVIEGRVVDAQTGAGLADVVVDAQRGRNSRPHTTRTDQRGRFRLSALSPGRYKPRVRDGAWLGHAEGAVAVELGETTSNVVIEAHAARQISGRALGDHQVPCTGRVTVRDASGEVANSQRPNALGEVRIGGLMPGEYTVVVSCTMQWEGAPGEEFVVDLIDADVEDAQWEAHEARHGERTLRGAVVGPDGEPVPFAEIEIVLDGGLEDGGLLAPMTVTDREGRFVIEHLPPGEYNVSAKQEGFFDHYSTVTISDRDADVELRLSSGVALRILAKDSNAAAVPGVEVKVSATIDRSGFWLETNAAGWTEARDLRPGTYRITVSQPGIGGKAGAEDPSRLDEGTLVTIDHDREHTVVVPSRDGKISGRAVRMDGDPVADARVEARSSETYLNFVGEPRTAVAAQARTDAQGNFVLEGLEAKTFTIKVRDAFGQTASRTTVEPGTSLTLELPEPGQLRGTVEIEGEDPPEHFMITVTPTEGSQYSEQFLRTDGRWSIVGVPPGAARVEVSSAWGTAQAEVDVEGGRMAAPMTLTLAPRSSIRGRLVGAKGQSLAGVHVVVLSDYGPATGTIDTTDAEGVFELADAPSGSVVVKVIAMDGHRPKSISTTAPSGEMVDLGVVALEALPSESPASPASD